MKKVFILIIVLFAGYAFSQEKKLKRHEVYVVYERQCMSSYWHTNKYNKAENYYPIPFLSLHYNNKFGLMYKFFISQRNAFDIKFIYNNVYLKRGMEYTASELMVPIGYSFNIIRDSRVTPYIGVQFLNRFIYNERTETSGTYVDRTNGESVNYIRIVEIKEKYKFGYGIRNGISFIIKKHFSINLENIIYLNKSTLKEYNTHYKYFYRLGTINFGLGYKF